MSRAAIPIALLMGAAIVLTAGAVFGRPAVLVLAVLLACTTLIGILADVRRITHDRRVGMRRLRQMRSNDALNRILDGKVRRG